MKQNTNNGVPMHVAASSSLAVSTSVPSITLPAGKRALSALNNRIEAAAQLAADAFHATYGKDVTASHITNHLTGQARMLVHAPAVESKATVEEARAVFASVMADAFGIPVERITVAILEDDAGWWQGRICCVSEDRPIHGLPWILVLRQSIAEVSKGARAPIPTHSTPCAFGGAR